MIIGIIGSLLTLVFPVITGSLVLFPILQQSKRKLSLLIVLPLAYALGLVIKIVFLAIGLALNLFTFGIIGEAVFALGALYYLWKHKVEVRNCYSIDKTDLVFLIGIGAFFLLNAGIALTTPILSNDARGIWLLHAKAIAAGKDAFLSYIQTPLYLYSHQDYPLGIPLIDASLFKIIGSSYEPIIVMFSTTFFCALASLLAGVLKQFLRKLPFWALVVTIVFIVFTPDYAAQGWNGYADVALSFFFASSAAAFIFALEEKANAWYLIALITSLGAAFIKNEGLTWFLLMGTLVIISLFLQKKLNVLKEKRVWYLLGFLALSLLPVIGWEVAKRTLHVQNDVTTGAKSITFSLLKERIPVLFQETLPRLFNSYEHGVLWIPALGVALYALWNFIRTITIEKALPYILVFGQLAIYFFIYLITPYDIKWHISTSFGRLILQLLPSVYLCAFYYGARILSA